MVTSIKTILIKHPSGYDLVVIPRDGDNKPYQLKRLGFPNYSSDLILEADRYPEYLLIQDLASKDVFNYFIQPI